LQVFRQSRISKKDIQREIEQPTSTEMKWSVYINAVHCFKIAWPSQTWAIEEVGNVMPDAYIPIQLRFNSSTKNYRAAAIKREKRLNSKETC
jgi:hypothetical protein